MKSTTILKIATMISFLLIVFPDYKLFLVNFIFLIISLLSDSSALFYTENQTHFFILLKSLFLFTFTALSILLIFRKNKYTSLICIAIQYFYLIYLFDISYIKYWYYTLPTSIYLVLSIILLYYIFFKKNQDQK